MASTRIRCLSIFSQSSFAANMSEAKIVKETLRQVQGHLRGLGDTASIELLAKVDAALSTSILATIDPRITPTCSEIELTPQLQEELRSVDFDHWKYDDADYEVFIAHFLLSASPDIDKETLQRFVTQVRAHYNPNPFHCFAHGFTVIHMAFCIIENTDLKQKLSVNDKLILLVSALCHDIDHPGLTNSFQVNSQTPLALRYNDESPLENHHCSTAFLILSDFSCNIFAGQSREDYQQIRRGMIDCIMATDIAKQPFILAQVQAIASQFDIQRPEHRSLLLVMLMKASDISLEVRPFDIAQTWVKRLFDEFNAQAKLERKMGLPVMPHMEVGHDGLAQAQVGFIEHVLMPLFQHLAKLVPEVETKFIPRIQESLDKYKKLSGK
jgi:high affinity cGMP-specific 3',5'-cyclic phosphodiesterase 9